MSLESRSSLYVPPALGERPREVFRHLVETFLTTGEPVGSRTLAQRLPLALSPASIRTVMSDLEALGLLYLNIIMNKGLSHFIRFQEQN